LLLINIGHRTGLRRYTVLEIMEYRKEGPEAVVMSAFGPNADWLRNIEATPSPEVSSVPKTSSPPTASSMRRRR
jgi:hypothetical protein